MKTIIAIAIAAASTCAQAGFMSGNELLSRMNSGSPALQSGALGYVMGAFDSGYRVTHCAPNTITAGQAHDIIQKWLTDNPQYRHYDASSLILTVFEASWPCAQKNSSRSL